jgi:glycosyltransferase involved in cell wall biosynthesis
LWDKNLICNLIFENYFRYNMDNVSVLICCKNSEEFIEQCLISISDQSPFEIVVIDGNSSDNTISIAKKFTKNIFSDEGKGLGYARKLGVSKCSGEFVIIVSPDDVISIDFIEKAMNEMQENPKLAALLAPKRMEEVGSFWDYGQDAIYKLTRQFPIRVVGNPSIYRGEYLKKFSYDENFSANEDTDLCERWNRAGYIVDWGKNFYTIEIEKRGYQEFKTRYIWYGKGDYRFFKKWKSIDEKVANRHLLHPFKNYIIKYSFYFLINFNFKAIPFTILCGYFRYYGFYLERKRLNNN